MNKWEKSQNLQDLQNFNLRDNCSLTTTTCLETIQNVIMTFSLLTLDTTWSPGLPTPGPPLSQFLSLQKFIPSPDPSPPNSNLHPTSVSHSHGYTLDADIINNFNISRVSLPNIQISKHLSFLLTILSIFTPKTIFTPKGLLTHSFVYSFSTFTQLRFHDSSL